MTNLIVLNEVLKACPDPQPPRSFPSIEKLLKERIAESPEQALAASLLWKRNWASIEGRKLVFGGETPVLDQLPATRRWIRLCHHRPNASEVRREALNELLRFHGVEPLYKTRHEPGFGQVSTDQVIARYLNAGDPYAATLIFRVGRTGPTVGCWGDLPEVDK